MFDFSYLSCNHESTEQIPQRIEWCSDYWCNSLAWSYCNRHHAEESEVQQSEIHEQYIQQKLS